MTLKKTKASLLNTMTVIYKVYGIGGLGAYNYTIHFENDKIARKNFVVYTQGLQHTFKVYVWIILIIIHV